MSGDRLRLTILRARSSVTTVPGAEASSCSACNPSQPSSSGTATWVS